MKFAAFATAAVVALASASAQVANTAANATTTTVTATLPLSYQDYKIQEKNAAAAKVDSGIKFKPLILSGTVVPEGAKTWVVGLRTSAEDITFCGGTLITPKHVLTAAHCFGSINYVSVGSHYVSGSSDGERIAVTKQTRHPEHNANTLSYDFLILELASASKYAPTSLVTATPSTGQSLTVLGWGVTSSGGKQPNELLQVKVPVIEHAMCAAKLTIDDSMLCAGGVKNKDACQGDSGGPLTNADDNLIGVVSWGNGCGVEGNPGVYGPVSVVKPWINLVTGNLAKWV